jgi:outer membrane protein TolC
MAEKSSRQLQREFVNARRSFLDVLTALEDEQSLRRNLLQARRQLLEYRVALYRALAGGLRPSK